MLNVIEHGIDWLLTESGILEFGIQLKESEIGIRNTSSIDIESGIQFQESEIVLYYKSAR